MNTEGRLLTVHLLKRSHRRKREQERDRTASICSRELYCAMMLNGYILITKKEAPDEEKKKK